MLIDNDDLTNLKINNRLIHREAEKKQFGEVFTPIELINEMLDKLKIVKA